jgi:hypothetical protein
VLGSGHLRRKRSGRKHSKAGKKEDADHFVDFGPQRT